jgi:hypothetical protein
MGRAHHAGSPGAKDHGIILHARALPEAGRAVKAPIPLAGLRGRCENGLAPLANSRYT